MLGNGITENRSYSNDNLLTAINYSNTSLGDLTYTWDANKNKTSESITGTMSGYGFTQPGTVYDDEDRLTGFARASGSLTQSWNLSTVGDWNSVTTNGTAESRTHGPTHELLTASGQSVNTDVKGNITLIPAVLSSIPSSASSLSWDFDNKLKSADVGNDSSTDVEFKYDAMGRRVARVGSSGSYVYVQSDQQTIADYGVGDAPSSPLYRYVFASYIDEPVVRKTTGSSGTVLYFHRNQQYSILALTDFSGNVSERYAYTAYGQPTFLNASATVQTSSAANNRYTYTGREWDATLGLHHFRARWMSGLTGRFLSRDPIEQVLSNIEISDNVFLERILRNRYCFALGSPIVFLELFGLIPSCPKGSTNAVTFIDLPLGGRMMCCQYYPDNLACNGLKEACYCRTKNKDPLYDETNNNGCTWAPLSVLEPACFFHDLCWNRCGANQDACDRAFLRRMRQICWDTYGPYDLGLCYAQANAFYTAVRRNRRYFQKTQDQACLWGPCKGLTMARY